MTKGKPIRTIAVESCPTCPMADGEGRCEVGGYRRWAGRACLPPAWCPLREHRILVSLVETPRATLDRGDSDEGRKEITRPEASP